MKFPINSEADTESSRKDSMDGYCLRIVGHKGPYYLTARGTLTRNWHRRGVWLTQCAASIAFQTFLESHLEP